MPPVLIVLSQIQAVKGRVVTVEMEAESIYNKGWPHAPSHWFRSNANYFVTASTYLRQRLFCTDEKLDFLQATFFEQAAAFKWQLHAWAFLSNHYHVVMTAPVDANTLKPMLQSVHSITAREINRMDNVPARQVWYNYRDTCLTYRNSYLARLNYTNNNPVKHRLVPRADMYKWCSMAWFSQAATPAFQKTVASFPVDRVNVWDDFD